MKLILFLESSLKSTIDLIPMIHRIADQFIYWNQNMPRILKDMVLDKNTAFKNTRKRALAIQVIIMMSFILLVQILRIEIS